MKLKFNLIWLLAFGIAFNPIASYADEHEEGEDTMTMVEEGDSEEGIVAFIELPLPNDNAERGIGIASAARNPEIEKKGGAFGEWVSNQVRSEVVSQAADNASAAEEVRQDVRDNAQRDAKGDNGEGNRGRP